MKLLFLTFLLSVVTYTSAQTGQRDHVRISITKTSDESKIKQSRELERQAKYLSNLGKYTAALALRIKILANFEKVLGPEHPDTASALNNLSVNYSELAEYENALPLQIRALAIREKILGLDHPSTGVALSNLALTYSDLTQYGKALPLLIKALTIFDKKFGPENDDTANALNNLAMVYSNLAQFDKSLPLQIQILNICEKKLGSNHLDTARAINNLAVTYSQLAQHDKALTLKIRALEIYEKILGSEHPDTARAIHNLAATYSHLEKLDKALPLKIRALAIFEKSYGPEHPSIALALNNLAVTYFDLAQHQKVLPLLIRALLINEKMLGSEHPENAMSLNNIALTYYHLGQYDKVLPLQIQALAINEKTLGSDHPETAKIKANLASTILLTDNSDSGLALLKSAINSLQGQRQLVSRIGTSELKSYSESLSSFYQGLADLLIERGRLSEAQQVLDMLKEDEQFDFIRRAPDTDPRNSKIGYTSNEQVWLKRYREISDQLGKLGSESRELEKQAKLGSTPQQKQRQQVIASDLKVAQAAFREYLEQMREDLVQKGQARKVDVEEVSTQSMRESQSLLKGLGDDVALLQYYVTNKRVGMLLTTSGIQLARSSDIDSKELNRMISEFRRLLQDPKSNPVAAAQVLYNTLMAPVAKDLDDAKIKTVMLSLDGVLRYLPFAALHDGKQYLVRRWNLPMYTSVTKAKLRDSVSAQWQAAGLGVTKAWPEFTALAGVKAEIASIVKTTTGGLMPGEIYLDEEFTATLLKTVSQRKFPLLHVASHFRFSPGTEVNSFLLLGDGQHLTIGDIRTQNYRFDNVDLLTLSACDTGLGGGRDEQGKEIEGFGVIAQQQGAKSVLATLWKVSDQSTAMLMTDLYRRRQSDGLTKVEALRQSQIALYSNPKYSHPFYWGPFILMGNWK